MAPSAFKLASKTALNFTWKKQTLTFYNDELTKWCLKINFLQSSQLKFPSWPHNSIERIQEEIKNRRHSCGSRECVTFQPFISVSRHWGLESNNNPPGEGNILRLGHLCWNNPDEDQKNANSFLSDVFIAFTVLPSFERRKDWKRARHFCQFQ